VVQGESQNEMVASGTKKRGLINGLKSKIEEVKKQWAPKINEKLLYVTSTNNQEHEDEEEMSNEVVIPDPDEACNWVIRRLLESK
jgi:hypothetical protein